MASWYLSSVAHAAITQWSALEVIGATAYRRQLAAPAVGNERVFKATTLGTAGAAEPTWNLTDGSTTNDGTVVWTQVAGREAEQVADNWRAAAARFSAIPALATNDNVFVSDDHAETQSTPLATPSTTSQMWSVRRTGGSSLPPITADLLAGASISMTGITAGTSRLTFNGIHYYNGVTFKVGSGAGAAPIRNGSTVATYTTVENGMLEFVGSGGGATVNENVLELANLGSFPSELVLINTSIKGASTAYGIWPSVGSLRWSNTPNAVQGSAPATLIKQGAASGFGGLIEIRGCDLSTVTDTIVDAQNGTCAVVIADCKVAVGVKLWDAGAVIAPRTDAGYIRIDNCDDATSNTNYRFLEMRQGGRIESDAVVYRTGGASDGVTSYCWKMTGVSATIFLPLLSRRIAQRYGVTGAAKTATVEIIVNNSVALTDAQAWLDVEALTSAASPISTFGNDRVADLLPSTDAATQATSTVAWSAPARANSTAYALGDARAVASNPGRVFFCTTAGTSAASEPGGYASAVDGGSVTDGTAVFRAGWRQKIEGGFTPQKIGFVFGVVQIAANSIPVYADPMMTIA